MHICYVETGCGDFVGLPHLFVSILLLLSCPNFFCDLTRLLFWIFVANLVGFLGRIMSAGSPQRKVRQRTVEDKAVLQAMTMDRIVIAELNVIRSDIMVPPLDSIHAIIQTYNWGSTQLCMYGVHQTGKTLLRQLGSGAKR
jgi:hypothetical protein